MKKIATLLLAFLLTFSYIPFALAATTPISNARIEIEYESNLQYTSMLNSFSEAYGAQKYPNYYGGAYLNSDGLLVVNVTERTPTIEQEIKSATGNTEIIISVVNYSYNYLLDLHDQIVEFIEKGTNEHIAASITSFAVLDNSNDLEIGLTELSNKAISEFVEEVFEPNVARSSGLSIPLSFVEQTSPSVLNQSPGPSLSATAASSSLYCGDQIEDYDSIFSVGFPCYYRENGVLYAGFVTAAHGCSDGATITNANQDVIGTVKAWQYSGTVDAAFVAITNSSFSMPTVIDAVVSSGTTDYHSYYTVTPGGSVVPAVGTTLFKDGKTTNTTFATVDSIYASNYWPAHNVTISDLIRVDEEIAAAGDSGGIAFTLGTGNYASTAGIVQSAGSGKVCFVKHSNIVNALDLILVP